MNLHCVAKQWSEYTKVIFKIALIQFYELALFPNSYLFDEFGDIVKCCSDWYHWGERSKMCGMYGGIRIKDLTDRSKASLSSIESGKFNFGFPADQFRHPWQHVPQLSLMYLNSVSQNICGSYHPYSIIPKFH